MSGLTQALGYSGIIIPPAALLWASGVATVQLWDNRNHRRELAESAVTGAKLAEGRANQQAGFPVHDFDARRETAA